MFRELMRKNKAIDMDACIALLTQETRGVLSVLGDNEYPYGMPMNHYYNEEDKCIYFHCGKAGHRLDALKKHDKVSFCVYDKGSAKEGEWALEVRSVIVFGRMEIVSDMDAVISITTKLCHKFTQDENYIQNEIRQYAAGTLLLKLTPEHISGKCIMES